MKAQRWVAAALGGPEVLELQDVELAVPQPGQVIVAVRASGLNPADAKHIAAGQPSVTFPLTLGYEVAGVIAAIGPGTHLASGGGAVGDEVIAFQVADGYSTAITLPAADVFAKPSALSWAEAAGLLLVGSTAAEMLDTAGVVSGDTVLLHGAAGGVGTSVLQLAALIGARVIGTADPAHAQVVAGYGGVPVAYGPGLEERVRALAPAGVAAALDAVGTDEALDVSLALVADRRRIVSIAAFGRGPAAGITLLGAGNPASAPFRAAARPRLIGLAGKQQLVPRIGATFPFAAAPEALRELLSGRSDGKVVLVDEA